MSFKSYVGEKLSDHAPDFLRKHPKVAATAGAVALGLYALHHRKAIKAAVVDAWHTAQELAEEYEIRRRASELGTMVMNHVAGHVNQVIDKLYGAPDRPGEAAADTAVPPEPLWPGVTPTPVAAGMPAQM